MSPTKQTAFRLSDETLDALQRIKHRDGIPLAEQVRRALASWIEEKEGKTEAKAARKRAGTRKRA